MTGDVSVLMQAVRFSYQSPGDSAGNLGAVPIRWGRLPESCGELLLMLSLPDTEGCL